MASKIVNAFTQPLPPSKLSRPVKISMKHNYKVSSLKEKKSYVGMCGPKGMVFQPFWS